jgi:Protein of unknown function (DUF5818)
MNKWIAAAALAASFSIAASAEQLTGYISDAHCGAKHASVSEANTKCVNGCLKGGAAPVLVSDGKVYKLDADSAEKVKSFAGQSVKVDGTIDGDSVKVTSVEAGQ